MHPLKHDLDTLVSALDKESNSPSPKAALSHIADLFEHYAPAIRAFMLRRLGNIEDAREATQEVFLNLWRQEQKGALESEARAYLFTAAHNWVKDRRRKMRSHGLDRYEPLDEHELVSSQPNDEDTVHWRAGLEMVVNSLKDLPAETQRIFHLYHGSRMTYPEIAKELGVTSRTVERHMAHAIAHCKQHLKAYLS